MFPRLAEHYRSLTQDLVLSLQALASGLQSHGISDSCYVCGDLQENQGASFVAEIGEQHLIRFLVSDCGISWVESRNGHELVKLDGAEDEVEEVIEPDDDEKRATAGWLSDGDTVDAKVA